EGSNTCVIVQMGDDNKARCKLRDTGEPDESQKCDITQTEAERNSADIDMTIEQRTGPEQGAEQQAFVHQEASERNQSQVHQADGGRDNASHLHQAIGEKQSTKAADATQLQGDLPTGQEGAIHQENPDGVGQNADLANQDQRQLASGPGGTTQAQHTGDG